MTDLEAHEPCPICNQPIAPKDISRSKQVDAEGSDPRTLHFECHNIRLLLRDNFMRGEDIAVQQVHQTWQKFHDEMSTRDMLTSKPYRRASYYAHCISRRSQAELGAGETPWH